MASSDLDNMHRDRLKGLQKKLPFRRSNAISKIFVGEKIIESVDKPKLVIEGYRLTKILPILPFTPVLYVAICPGCIQDKDELQQYLSLVRNDLVVPVLTGKYSQYPEPLVDDLRSRDHISCYEYSFFKFFQSRQLSKGPAICQHCFEGRGDKIIALAKGAKGNRKKLESSIKSAVQYLAPPIYPDYEILDQIESAVVDNDVARVEQLADLARAMHQIRDAQVWNAALALSADDLALVPEHISPELDEGRVVASGLRELVAEGLGMKIPANIPIDKYAEIVREFRPRITSIVDHVVDKSGNRGAGSEEIIRELSHLNNEVARIKNLKRYMLLEAIAQPVRKNKAIVASGLVAGALGVSGSLIGCIGAAGVAGALKVGSKTKIGEDLAKKVASNHHFVNLAQRIQADLRPQVDKMIALYLQADLPAVSILSIKEDLGRVQKAA